MSVVPLGKLLNKIFSKCFSSRLLDFIFTRIPATIADIVVNGVVKQECFLVDKGDMLLETFNGHITDVLPIDPDGTLLRIVKTRKQPDDSRFTRTAGTNQGDNLTRIGL